jgi:hypothetical protein
MRTKGLKVSLGGLACMDAVVVHARQAVVKVRVGEQAGATGVTSSRITHTKLHHTHLGGCLGNIINFLLSVVGALQIYRGYTQHGDHIVCYIME